MSAELDKLNDINKALNHIAEKSGEMASHLQSLKTAAVTSSHGLAAQGNAMLQGAKHDVGNASVALLEKAEKKKTAILQAQSRARMILDKMEAHQRIEFSTQAASGVLSAADSLLGNSKKNAQLHKQIAAAQAVISTSTAVMQAITSPPGFPWTLPLGVAVGAMGAAQLSKIEGQKFASGTNFAPGGMALVGEQGPELVSLPRGSAVHTASESRDMGGGGDTHHFNLHFHGAVDRSHAGHIADTVHSKFREFQRTQRNTAFTRSQG